MCGLEFRGEVLGVRGLGVFVAGLGRFKGFRVCRLGGFGFI